MILVEFLLSPSDTCQTYLSLLSLHSSQMIDIDLAKILQALPKYLCLCAKLVCFTQRFVLASYMLALCSMLLPSYIMLALLAQAYMSIKFYFSV